MYPKYKVTYLDAGVTQTMYCVPQDEYNVVRRALNLKDDKNAWEALGSEERALNKSIIEQGSYVLQLNKKGTMFTDESPIGMALKAGDGFLNLPKAQGGTSRILFEQIKSSTEFDNFVE